MALLTNPFVKLTLSYKDRENNDGSVSINMPNTVALTEVAETAEDLRDLIATISDAVFVGWSASYGATETAPALAAETSDVERKGSFRFRDGAGYITVMQVPSILNTLVIDGTNSIDAADTDVAAFVTAMTGATFGDGRPVSNHGANLVSLKAAKKIHRGSSKG